MKVVIQRVLKANVSIGGNSYSTINKGMLILVGIQADDNKEDIQWLGYQWGNEYYASDYFQQ